MPDASNDPCGAAMDRRVNAMAAATRTIEKPAVRIQLNPPLRDISAGSEMAVPLRRQKTAAQRPSTTTRRTSLLAKPSWRPLKIAIHTKKRQEESPRPIPAARDVN